MDGNNKGWERNKILKPFKKKGRRRQDNLRRGGKKKIRQIQKRGIRRGHKLESEGNKKSI